jgi:hypothetical protein
VHSTYYDITFYPLTFVQLNHTGEKETGDKWVALMFIKRFSGVRCSKQRLRIPQMVRMYKKTWQCLRLLLTVFPGTIALKILFLYVEEAKDAPVF